MTQVRWSPLIANQRGWADFHGENFALLMRKDLDLIATKNGDNILIRRIGLVNMNTHWNDLT